MSRRARPAQIPLPGDRRTDESGGWRRDGDGAVVVMLSRYGHSVWREFERRSGLPVVSALQLILDRWHYPLGGSERAERLLATELGPIWRG